MPEHAFRIWKWLHSLDWAHLPNAGGLLDQDERIMSDVMIVQWQYKLIKGHVAANAVDEEMQSSL